MEPEPRNSRWTVWTIVSLMPTLLLLVVLVFRLVDPKQQFLRGEVARAALALGIVGLILKAGEPIAQLLGRALPAYSKLDNLTRFGMILALFSAMLLLVTIPATLFFTWPSLLLPPATALYCTGLFLVQRSSQVLGKASYSQFKFATSLMWSLLGSMLLTSPPWVDNTESWMVTLLIIYMLTVFPVGMALMIVQASPRSRKSST